jgi:hypothetical protein
MEEYPNNNIDRNSVASDASFTPARFPVELGLPPGEESPTLTSSLASTLEARMKQMVDGLQKRLAERADKEAEDIESILTELKKSIEAELKDPAYIQPLLFDDPEQERFERNKDAMRARAKEIPGEIKRETEAIRARFASPQARMFPVAVMFLVPEKMAGG